MLRFSCPGKTFIVGEYACIEGGPALLATPSPSFSLTVEQGVGGALPFAGQSPAGLYLLKHLDLLEGHRFTWHDPYQTAIGVGSSSAQFILSVAAVASLRDEAMPDAHEVLDLYWQIVGDAQGLRPSGVDVVAQWLGGPILVRNKPFVATALHPWNASARFMLAYTGSKEKTHEHLRHLLERGFPNSFSSSLTKLNALTDKAVQAWNTTDGLELGAILNEYQRTLMEAGLASVEITATLEELQATPGVYGCKGSGAQGGDCVIMLVEGSSCDAVSRNVRARGWTPFLVDWSDRGLRRD